MQINLAEVIREWRWSQRKTLSAVSKVIGVSKATLSRVERGETPDGQTLRKILMWLLTEA